MYVDIVVLFDSQARSAFPSPAVDAQHRAGHWYSPKRDAGTALPFGDIDFARGLITLRGETTKSKKTRFVPIAMARLRAVLEWLQLEAAGEKKPDDALVFSDEAGEPVGRLRTAWVTAVLEAHGIKPVGRRTAGRR